MNAALTAEEARLAQTPSSVADLRTALTDVASGAGHRRRALDDRARVPSAHSANTAIDAGLGPGGSRVSCARCDRAHSDRRRAILRIRSAAPSWRSRSSRRTRSTRSITRSAGSWRGTPGASRSARSTCRRCSARAVGPAVPPPGVAQLRRAQRVRRAARLLLVSRRRDAGAGTPACRTSATSPRSRAARSWALCGRESAAT